MPLRVIPRIVTVAQTDGGKLMLAAPLPGILATLDLAEASGIM